MERFNKLAAPATEKLRQLQKMVQDIKNNDGSILDKLRGLKSKPAPKVPARDYQGDVDDDSQWSDAEFDSDTYEDPQEDHDDSYEPPPSHKVFRPSPPGSSVSRGEYVDSCPGGRPRHSPRKPLRPPKAAKPLPPEPPQTDYHDEEDYVNPETDNGDYIEPTAKPTAGLYVIPCMEESSPVIGRPACPKTPPQTAPRRASPRLLVWKPHALPVPVPQSTQLDEYEVCDPDNGPNAESLEEPVRVAPPKPRPRESRGQKPALMPRPDLSSREHAGSTSSVTQTGQKHTTASLPFELKRPKIPLPQFASHKQVDRGNVPRAENVSTDTDEDADVVNKPWYASACPRKTAEDALIHSNKDGSFLLRKSSGQDAEQPYTLVVLYNGRVYNIPVRYVKASRQYALGRDKRGEERFSSVSSMIESHQKNPLVLIDGQSNSKDSTKLCHPVKP